jgi:uncharacterized membrane protein
MISFVSVGTALAVAATPVIERGALPLALHGFHLPLALALPVVIIGNALPAVAVVYFLDPIMLWLGKYIPALHRFAVVILASFRKKVHPFVDRFGTVGLVIFVAIPTPITGSWTGAGAAAVLGMHKKRAVAGIIIGAAIANLIVLAMDYGLFTVTR